MATALVERWFANRFVHRVAHKALFALALSLCLLWTVASALRGPQANPAPVAFHEWPTEWDGMRLRPLALGEVERRFAARFPGAIARMTDGESQFVLRQVRTPTRMLHPAADCYRAAGYRITQTQLTRDGSDRLWRCFVAQGPDGRKSRVCERIVDSQGLAFTDTSAWYWSAVAGRSSGPWQAVTLARTIE